MCGKPELLDCGDLPYCGANSGCRGFTCRDGEQPVLPINHGERYNGALHLYADQRDLAPADDVVTSRGAFRDPDDSGTLLIYGDGNVG